LTNKLNQDPLDPLDEDEFLSVGILNDVEVSNTIENCTEGVCTSVVETDQTSTSSFSSES